MVKRTFTEKIRMEDQVSKRPKQNKLGKGDGRIRKMGGEALGSMRRPGLLSRGLAWGERTKMPRVWGVVEFSVWDQRITNLKDYSLS